MLTFAGYFTGGFFASRCALLPEVTTAGGVSLSRRAPVEITELRRCEWTGVGQHIEAALQHQ